MKRLSIALLLLAGCGVLLAAQAKPAKPLEIYVIDVEGGKSDLWITPAGQNILIDTATGGDRDLNRILDTLTAAGVTKIDYMITTHYHSDHAGNLAEIAKRIPITNFVDHGLTTEAPLVAVVSEPRQDLCRRAARETGPRSTSRAIGSRFAIPADSSSPSLPRRMP